MTPNDLEAPVQRFEPFARIGKAIGRIGIPVRAKLLIAFVGIVALMISLALTGMSELRKANQRAAELVDDHLRIDGLNNLRSAIGETTLAGIDIFAGTQSASSEKSSTYWFATQLKWMQPVVVNATGGVDGSTKFIGPEMANEMRQTVREFETTGKMIASLYNDGDVNASRNLFEAQLRKRLKAFDREVLKLTFELRKGMRNRAKINEAAFQRARQIVLAASGLAVILAVALGFSISTSIIHPLDRIRQTLRIIARGDFTARVTVPNRDELGELAANVNVTSERLGTLYNEVDAQRTELAEWNTTLEDKVATQIDQIERTNRLRRFLPAQVADLIVGAQDGEDMLGSKRGEVTVLFADLRGFTAFSNAVPPEQVIEALNAFHATSGPLIEARGGTLERFLGDGLMVLFGAPVPMENAAESAVALAKDMQEAFRPALEPFQTRENSLGLGIGIATGIATLGQIGFEGRLDYSAIGPAPNLASRLCDHASDGQILLCEATAPGVDIPVAPAGPFRLKGIGEDIPAFEV